MMISATLHSFEVAVVCVRWRPCEGLFVRSTAASGTMTVVAARCGTAASAGFLPSCLYASVCFAAAMPVMTRSTTAVVVCQAFLRVGPPSPAAVVTCCVRVSRPSMPVPKRRCTVSPSSGPRADSSEPADRRRSSLRRPVSRTRLAIRVPRDTSLKMMAGSASCARMADQTVSSELFRYLSWKYVSPPTAASLARCAHDHGL